MSTQNQPMSTLDKIGWAALFTGLIALVARRFIPFGDAARQALIDRLSYASMAVAAVGALLIVYANRKGILAGLRTRQAKHGANSLILTVTVIGIVGLMNYLGSRYHWRFDLTEAKSFTLSEQTLRILGTLQEDVTVTAFYQENNPSRAQVKDLLGNYEYATKHLKVTYVDPDKQPALAQQFAIERYGTTVFAKGDRKEKVTTFGEQDFTSALIKLSKRKETKVYFVEGHGEQSLDEFGDKGISKLKEALGKDHYLTEALSLPVKQMVPSDADVVVVAGPRRPVTSREVQALSDYMDKGGKLLVLVDPTVDSGLDAFLAQYSVKLDRNLVIDPIQHLWTDVATPAVNRYRFHEITNGMNGSVTGFPRSRSVSLAEKQPLGQIGTVLAETSPAGWGESNLANPKVDPNDGGDLKGPVPLAVAVGRDAPKAPKPVGDAKPAQTRLVVIGNSTFVANGMLTQNAGNSYLAQNAINWLAQEESLIAIRPKPPTSRSITLTNPQMSAIFTGSVLILPAAILLLGTLVWYRRR